MEFNNMCDRSLLALLIGDKAANQIYRGRIHPLVASNGDSKPHPKLAAAMELALRVLRETIEHGPALDSPAKVRDYLALHFYQKDHEAFVVIFLDAINRVIAATEMFKGTLRENSVYPREVVKEALRRNAAACIFAHNHPTGVAEPSRADELLTANLKRTLAIVDVVVLDHFVVAGNPVTSMAELGLM